MYIFAPMLVLLMKTFPDPLKNGATRAWQSRGESDAATVDFENQSFGQMLGARVFTTGLHSYLDRISMKFDELQKNPSIPGYPSDGFSFDMPGKIVMKAFSFHARCGKARRRRKVYARFGPLHTAERFD